MPVQQFEMSPDLDDEAGQSLTIRAYARLRSRIISGELAPGQRLKVNATDPLAAIDLPHFCAESGHRLVATATEGPRLLFLVERGETAG